MKTTGQHHKVSLTDRHERIKSIADELDAFLEKMQQAPWAKGERCRELHKLRGYCEQLRVDAESLKNGADGFGKGVEMVDHHLTARYQEAKRKAEREVTSE